MKISSAALSIFSLYSFASSKVIAQVLNFGRVEDVPTGYNLQCTDPAAPSCIPCEAREKVVSRRIRREVRDLSKEQWDAFVFCMWQMKILSIEEGQAKYGPLFKTQEWFVTYHAVASMSARGDQGHGGSIFLSFHGIYLAMYETTLMEIAKVEGLPLDGLPYWWNLDDPSIILSDEYFGTHPGLGPNYEVTDGAFANWEIESNFRITDWEGYMLNTTDNTYEGHEGFLRAPYNTLNTVYFSAFPFPNENGTASIYAGFDYETALACLKTPFDAEQYTITNFTYCIDAAGDVGPPNTFHSGTHAIVGGGFANPFVEDPDFWGDFSDPVTSANGPIFAPFHATLDLFVQAWKEQNVDHADTTWGFPYALNYDDFNADFPLRDGVNGNDTISSAWPAYWQDIGWATPDSPDSFRVATHVQAHCYLSKENADYVYVRYSNAPESFPGGITESELAKATLSPTADATERTDDSESFHHSTTMLSGLPLALLASTLQLIS